MWRCVNSECIFMERVRQTLRRHRRVCSNESPHTVSETTTTTTRTIRHPSLMAPRRRRTWIWSKDNAEHESSPSDSREVTPTDDDPAAPLPDIPQQQIVVKVEPRKVSKPYFRCQMWRLKWNYCSHRSFCQEDSCFRLAFSVCLSPLCPLQFVDTLFSWHSFWYYPHNKRWQISRPTRSACTYPRAISLRH